MKAAKVCTEAARLLDGERAAQHGDAVETQARLAAAWTWWLRCRGLLGPNDLSALDTATMLELLKITRRSTGAFNLDDYVDSAGYAGIAGEMAAQEAGMEHEQ